MEFIAHRVNTIEELKSLPEEYGLELDLRDHGDEIILQHDPFLPGQVFDEFLDGYCHGTLILNIKSERIEHRVQAILQARGLSDYFFLDSSFPMIKLLSEQGDKKIAVRFSEFETIETVLKMSSRIDWVWVDCFSKLPIDRDSYHQLKSAGFKLCLVSPELQGRPEDIKPYKQYLQNEEIQFDAICTKLHNIELWR